MSRRRVMKDTLCLHDAQRNLGERHLPREACVLCTQVSEWSFPTMDTHDTHGVETTDMIETFTVDPPPFDTCGVFASAQSDPEFRLGIRINGLVHRASAPHPSTFWPALVGVRLHLCFVFSQDFPFTPPDVSVWLDDRRARSFGPLPVGTSELDPAPWRVPAGRGMKSWASGTASEDEWPGCFGAVALLQQSLRFRIDLLHETVTRTEWRARQEGLVFIDVARVNSLRAVEANRREYLAVAEEEMRALLELAYRRASAMAIEPKQRQTLAFMLAATGPAVPKPADASDTDASETDASETDVASYIDASDPDAAYTAKLKRGGLAALRDPSGNLHPFPVRHPDCADLEIGKDDLLRFAVEKTGLLLGEFTLERPADLRASYWIVVPSSKFIKAGDVIRMVACRPRPPRTVLVPHGSLWTIATTLDGCVLLRLNDDLYCLDAEAVANSGNAFSVFTCTQGIGQLLDAALALLGRVEGVASIVPRCVVDSREPDGALARPSHEFFTAAAHADDRVRLFDAMQWVLRAASPSPLVRIWIWISRAIMAPCGTRATRRADRRLWHQPPCRRR